MNKLLKGIFGLAIMILMSCSTGLYKVTGSYIQKIEKQKTFNLKDFDVYVFNICEKYTKAVDNTERFCNCPNNFYDVAKNDSIKKIEEVYFLIHKQTDLALYLTTVSHKYISNKQKGFLNDSSRYKDKINLKQIEYAYVGKINRSNNKIHFKHPGDEKDMLLNYNPLKFPAALVIDSANIATVENKYSISKAIDMSQVFSTQLDYKKSACSVVYYMKEQKLLVENLILTVKKGKLNLLFEFNNYNDKLYKMSSKRLRYQLDYAQIDTLN